MVQLMSAKLEFAANLKVMKTAEQVQQHLLDVTA
jgi:flagellar basal body rod protein FlgC